MFLCLETTSGPYGNLSQLTIRFFYLAKQTNCPGQAKFESKVVPCQYCQQRAMKIQGGCINRVWSNFMSDVIVFSDISKKHIKRKHISLLTTATNKCIHLCALHHVTYLYLFCLDNYECQFGLSGRINGVRL